MSYVTNPIANRLGTQQGWNNPLISLHSGLTNISFITYLKCYLLMQEYLRYSQINLVFFEVKPLQKNKKLIDLFVYQNILHLVKNELTFDSRKELTKDGFLQLALYLHRKKIKLQQFKLKRNYQIRHYDYCKKNAIVNQSAALQLVLKRNFVLKKYLKKSKLKKQLKKLKIFYPTGLSVKNFAMKVQNMRKLVKFRSMANCRPNGHKNKKYYKKKHVSWKITKNHFLNSQKSKKNYKNKTKRWSWKRKAKRGKVKAYKNKWQRHAYTQNKIQTTSPSNKQFLRAQKLLALSTKLIGPNINLLRKKIATSNLWPFTNFLNKKGLDLDNKSVSKKKLDMWNKPKWWLAKPNAKKKNKKTFRIQNNNFTSRLQIKKWILLKDSLIDRKQLPKMPSRPKILKNVCYALWKYNLFQPLMPKLVPALLHINFGPKVLRTWLWKNFEQSKAVNPLQFFFYLKSYMARNIKRTRNLTAQNIQFNRLGSKPDKLKLVWKNRVLYDLKAKKNEALYMETNSLAFTRYIGFINTHQNQQKRSKPTSIKLASQKLSAEVNLTKPIFYVSNFNSKFQKLNIAFRYFIEKYIQQYLKFPVLAKIKNVSDFIDTRSNQKNTNYRRQGFLKPLASKSFFIRLLNALLNIERVFEPKLFVELLATEMQQTKNYRKLAKNMISMFSVLHSEHIMGYKILIDGKLGGSKGKSAKQIFKLQNKEKIPIQTFTKKVSYALGVARTPAGLFGIRMWLYY